VGAAVGIEDGAGEDMDEDGIDDDDDDIVVVSVGESVVESSTVLKYSDVTSDNKDDGAMESSSSESQSMGKLSSSSFSVAQ